MWGKGRDESRLRRFLLPALVFAAFSVIVVCAGYLLIRNAAEELLDNEVKLDTELWASFVKRNIKDLPDIARGKPASFDTLAYLAYAREAGLIHAFRVYDADSILRLSSEKHGHNASETQEVRIDGIFADSIRNQTLKTVIRKGSEPGEPEYLASTILPINDGRKIAGWVVADVDQTDRRAMFFTMAAKVSLLTTMRSMISPGIRLESNTPCASGIASISDNSGFQVTAAVTSADAKAPTMSASEVLTTVTSRSLAPMLASARASR